MYSLSRAWRYLRLSATRRTTADRRYGYIQRSTAKLRHGRVTLRFTCDFPATCNFLPYVTVYFTRPQWPDVSNTNTTKIRPFPTCRSHVSPSIRVKNFFLRLYHHCCQSSCGKKRHRHANFAASRVRRTVNVCQFRAVAVKIP